MPGTARHNVIAQLSFSRLENLPVNGNRNEFLVLIKNADNIDFLGALDRFLLGCFEIMRAAIKLVANFAIIEHNKYLLVAAIA